MCSSDLNRGRERACRSVGVSVSRHEPWIAKDKVIRSYVGDVEVEKVGGFSSDDFEFGVVFQTPSCVWGSISILESPGVFHEMHP